jgi:hypothetical protein
MRLQLAVLANNRNRLSTPTDFNLSPNNVEIKLYMFGTSVKNGINYIMIVVVAK